MSLLLFGHLQFPLRRGQQGSMQFHLIEQILNVLGIYSAALRCLLKESLGNNILLPLAFNGAL
jgi:hypothetical protein